MKVDYINQTVENLFVRVTFVGYDAKGRRHPVIDLDAHDLARLIGIAKEFRARQKYLASQSAARIASLEQAGLAP